MTLNILITIFLFFGIIKPIIKNIQDKGGMVSEIKGKTTIGYWINLSLNIIHHIIVIVFLSIFAFGKLDISNSWYFSNIQFRSWIPFASIGGIGASSCIIIKRVVDIFTSKKGD